MDMEQLTPVEQSAIEESIMKPTGGPSDLLRYTKKRSKKKIVLIILAVAVLVIGFMVYNFVKSMSNMAMPVTVTTLQKQTLTDMVNLTGMVESAESAMVYPKSNGMVQKVYVKEGDYVEAGTVLAELDTTDLQLQIAQQQATLNKSVQTGEYSLSSAQREYDNMVEDLQNDKYDSLAKAEQTLAEAQRALNDARRDLNDHKDELNHADDVMNALEKKVNRAFNAMKTAEKDYNTAKKASDADPGNAALKAETDRLEGILQQKEADHKAAVKEYDENNTEYGGELTGYSKEYRQARLAYETALLDKELAEQKIGRTLENLKVSIDETAVSNDTTSQQIALQMLQNDLANSKIVAPSSGTVTAVYAKEGAPAGSGLMFIIENTEDLVVKTKVREYDVTSVKPGLSAIVKSDATGEEEYEGEVTFVSPTAAKAADGSIKSDGSVEFETDIALVSQNSGLRVGMNVRLNVILASKDDVYAVPYDAVITDMEGNDIVYVARTNEEGVTTAEQVVVTTGMETDFYIEISSADIQDGDLVISSPAGLYPGMPVTPLGGGMMAAA